MFTIAFFEPVKPAIKLFLSLDILKTLYFNFRVFPFRVAIKLPVYLSHKVQLMGVRRGSVELITVKSGGVKIGFLEYPMRSGKSMYTLLRICHSGDGAKLVLGGDNINIRRGVSVIMPYPNSKMTICNGVLVNQETMLYCGKEVYIGKNTRIGWRCQVYDNNFHFVYNKDTHTIANRMRRVKIGRNVWIANGCTVSTGAVIPYYSIVAAYSLLNKDFSNITTRGNFFAGSPAKLKKIGMFRLLGDEIEEKLHKWFSDNESMVYNCPEDFDMEKYLR